MQLFNVFVVCGLSRNDSGILTVETPETSLMKIVFRTFFLKTLNLYLYLIDDFMNQSRTIFYT